MALASDLMGLGVSPLIALRTASAGNGPLTITGVVGAASFASATRIQATQFLVSANNATTNQSYAISLPQVGGDAGAFLGDDFIINNAASGPLKVFCSSGVSISVAGSNTSVTTITTHSTMTAYPVSSTQWIGVRGGT